MAHTISHHYTQIKTQSKFTKTAASTGPKAYCLSCSPASQTASENFQRTVSLKPSQNNKVESPSYLIEHYLKDGEVHVPEKLWTDAGVITQDIWTTNEKAEVGI
ncbi:hypothetical protein QBC36DRAFT_315909 [Triangularia setosa]|uniref:Uncharacterized protein n=1 Tax=Triangularia setosa TaxID=2587417 RepID=A0AAN6VXP8_9PEZI|nr:hypothetical protein QBC36DRAFT_315909 [Podospora setosa]